MTKTLHQSRRVALDPRADSQLAWLQRTAAVVFGDPKQTPSRSQLVRRAIGLYADHVSDMIHAARMDDRSTLYPQDIAAERKALAEHGRIVDAETPGILTDAQGRLTDWQEAISRNIAPGLTIPIRREV